MNLFTYTVWVLSRKQYNSDKQPTGHKGQVKRKMFVGHTINNTFIIYLYIIDDNTLLSVVAIPGHWNLFEINL